MNVLYENTLDVLKRWTECLVDSGDNTSNMIAARDKVYAILK